MAKDDELPKSFKGATHRRDGVEPVKAVQWNKDGDHPDVQRYPIERREYKGLLIVGKKEKYALRFGDWIVENSEGRKYVVSGQPREQDQPGKEGKKKLPSEFEERYSPLALLLAFAITALYLIFGQQTDLPVLLGLGVTHLMYYSALAGQWNGLANAVFDLDTDTMKLAAATNTYVPNQDTHAFFSDVTNEVTGTNYTAGGATLANKTISRTTGTVTFDADDVVWLQSASGFSTARKFILYRSTGTAATSRLYSVVTADADVGNVTGDLTVAWNASGISTWSTT